MGEPYKLTVAQAADRIKDGTLSPVALAEACLACINALEPALKAWETVDRGSVLRQARRAEQEIRRRGPRTPLHGIPVGLKDIIYTRGVKTTASSRVYADFVPDFDATVVTRLKRAGAVILGKTVTAEFAATGDPPRTVNPWNPAHTPGGSSAGSAVAVAARMCPAALGSQTVGSTLRPAAYNGVVGLKPTYGLISRYGVIPASWSLDHVGILVRTVEDAALVLSVLAGYDPRDPSSARRRVPDYHRALERLDGPPRIGVLWQPFWERADAETRAHTEALVGRLAEAGARAEEVKLPNSFDMVAAAQGVVFNVECAAYHEEVFRERAAEYSPMLRRMLESAFLVPGVRYVQAQRLRRQFRREIEALAGTVDVFLTPSTPAPAPRDLSNTGDASFQGPWTFSGLPSISIPSGLARSGVPMGLQLVAAPFAEERLLAVARWCERVLDVRLRPPEPK
ncbi:MAG: amidase [Chloroflexi bacterium]|nr:amidase [Chloroflexota bacterium]